MINDLKKYSNEEIELHPENFYKDRHNNYYPYLKEDIGNKINLKDVSTIILFLKDMDYPFIDSVWRDLVKHGKQKQLTPLRIFGTYISKMRLNGYKNFTWSYTNTFTNFDE